MILHTLREFMCNIHVLDENMVEVFSRGIFFLLQLHLISFLVVYSYFVKLKQKRLSNLLKKASETTSQYSSLRLK